MDREAWSPWGHKGSQTQLSESAEPASSGTEKFQRGGSIGDEAEEELNHVGLKSRARILDFLVSCHVFFLPGAGVWVGRRNPLNCFRHRR